MTRRKTPRRKTPRPGWCIRWTDRDGAPVLLYERHEQRARERYASLQTRRSDVTLWRLQSGKATSWHAAYRKVTP